MENIFDRAHDLIDKAQERVATATSQAAWTANQTLVIKGLEGQLNTLQAEIDRVTIEIGNRTYDAWKVRTDDPRVAGLCGHLDDLKSRWVQVNGDLTAARAAAYDPRVIQSAWQANLGSAPPPAVVAPPVSQPPPQRIAPPVRNTPAPPTPRQAPPTPPRQQPPPQPAATTTPQAVTQPPPRPAVPPTPPAQPKAQEPPRPDAQARECPNCGHFVPASSEYCPSCGLRVT